MAENRRSEGHLITLNVTAASDIAAGMPVAISGTLAYNLQSGVTGLGNTATLNYNFIGISDQLISGGQCPITVWGDGVFRLQMSSACTTGNLKPGNPVWAASAVGMVITLGATGDAVLGTLIQGDWNATGQLFYDIKINPARLRWSTRGFAAVTGSAAMPLAFPQLSF